MNKGIDITKLKTKPLASDFSDYNVYNGQDFTVIRELEISDGLVKREIDEECAPMFLIKTESGAELHVYPEEIFTEESWNALLFNELYSLTEEEITGVLSEEKQLRYVEIITFLKENNVEIPFGIAV